ncbi:MAG: hypothetical protein U9R27_02720 [Campylobacterota bacterium]|nr:hypothetical protein [Campylobacterota bacterium]
MQKELFQTPDYQKLIASHLEETIHFLFENNQEFALACETKSLYFEPELPAEIFESFGETVLFVLTGYTYDTSRLEDGYFSFEAGFGEESFGSLVTLPLLAIKQIFVGEYPIMINISEPSEIEEEDSASEINSNKSMEALLSNPENKKLFAKKLQE